MQTMDAKVLYPTNETVAKLYDEMYFQRATQAYMWAIPIVSFAKWQEQHEKVFGQEDGDLAFPLLSRTNNFAPSND